MKFNVEVDLDWLEEGGSIDDELKQTIADSVFRRIDQKIISGITDKAVQSIQAAVDEKVGAVIEGFLAKKITVTDKWGDPTDKDIKIEDLIKNTFDKAMLEKVGKDGKPTSYSPVGTRMEYLVGKKVISAVDDALAGFGRNVDAAVKEHADASMKRQVAEKLTALMTDAKP